MPVCAPSQEGRSAARSDATGPLAEADLGAALERCRTAGIEGGVPALRGAVAAGENPLAAVVAAWEVLRRQAGESVDVRLHRDRWRQLNRALKRADRWGSGGLVGRGHGAEVLIGWMEASAADLWHPLPVSSRHSDREERFNAANEGTTVRSLAHFVCLLDQASRRWRRACPEVADRRERRARRRDGS